MRLFYIQTQEPTGRTLGRGPTASRRDNRESERETYIWDEAYGKRPSDGKTRAPMSRADRDVIEGMTRLDIRGRRHRDVCGLAPSVADERPLAVRSLPSSTLYRANNTTSSSRVEGSKNGGGRIERKCMRPRPREASSESDTKLETYVAVFENMQYSPATCPDHASVCRR